MRYLFVLIFIVTCSSGWGQGVSKLNPEKRPSQYILKGWSTEDGLTSESTNDMVQTSDGYIWIGTYTGLHRFDGKDFTVFTSLNSALPSSNILRMSVDQDGTLWLGTLHGVVTYKDGEITVPPGLESASDHSIEEMTIASNGDVWFSSKSNHLFQYSQGKLIEWTDDFSVKKSTVLAIEEGKDGNIYLGTDDSQLLKFTNNGQISKIPIDNEVNGISEITMGKTHIYVGTGKGLYFIHNESTEKSEILPNTSIRTIIEDDTGILWMGTMRGLFRYNKDNDRLDSLTESQGLPNNIIRTMTFDDEGNFWAGTYRSGAFFLSDGSITSFTKSDGLHSNVISNVTEFTDGSYLLGNESGKLNLIKNNLITDYIPEIPLPNARLKHLFTDNQGRVWASTYAGLFMFDGPRSRKYVVDNGFPDNFVRLVFQHSDGSIWVGTKNAGLIKFKTPDSWEIIDTQDGLTSDYIMSIVENSKGQLIVGTISGLNILDNEQVIKNITIEDGLPSNFTFSSYPTENYIWIASNDGLIAYSEERTVTFNETHGMPSKIIYEVIGDQNGNLWMPGEKAILKANLKELEETIATGGDMKIKVQQFDKSNGMKNSHCLGGVLSYVDNDGNFWIPTQMGVVNLDPSSVETIENSARAIIEDIYADGVKLPQKGPTLVPSGTNRLNIDFTGISYRLTDKLEFRYKLVPFDNEWVDAGDERNALYTNLPPGDYKFQLQAGVEGEFFESNAETQIYFQATWWQTIWARVALVVLLVSVGLVIYLIRVRSLTSQNKRLEEMVSSRTAELLDQKEELTIALENLSAAQEQMLQSEKMASLGILAAGVAHEINNPLNYIHGGLLGLEKQLESNGSQAKELIPELINVMKVGVSRASTIVSSLNEFSHQADNSTEECDIHHVIENCLNMLQHELKHKVEVVKFFTKDTLITMGNTGKLHQVFLNLITNAAQAIDEKGTIKISTRTEKGHHVIEIEDSGVGIPKSDLKKITEPFYTTKEPGEGTGLGLSITYKIVQEHKGSISFVSEPGKGTRATIVLQNISKKKKASTG